MRRGLRLASISGTLLALMALVASCSAAPAAAPTTKPQPTTAPAAPAAPTKAPAAPAAAPTTASQPAPVKPLSPVVKLKVAVVGTVADAGIYIADERGYFKEEGIEIETLPGTSQDMYSPMATGQIDVAGIGPNSGFFNAIARDIPIKIVADKGSLKPGFPLLGFVVRTDLIESGAYKSLADLKGMNIAESNQGVGVNIDLDKVLEKAGLTRKDIKITLIPFPNQNPAYGNKQLDAGIQQEPLLTAGVAAGLYKKVIGLDEVYPNHQVGCILYSPQFAKNTEVANRFMVAYIRGVRDYNDAFDKAKNKDRADIINILAKRTTVKDVAIYDKMGMAGLNPDGYVNAESIAIDAKWFLDNGYIKQQPDLKTIIDNSYVDYAIQRLGKYK